MEWVQKFNFDHFLSVRFWQSNSNIHVQWHNWRGARGRTTPPGKLNVKTGPPVVDIMIFCFRQVVFLRFFRRFRFFI